MSLLGKFKQAADAALDSYLAKARDVVPEMGYEQEETDRKGFISMDGPQNQQGLFKERISSAGPDVLKSMARKDSMIVAIHQALINQVANFTQPQRDKYSPGFRFVARKPADLTRDERLSLTDPELDDDAFEALKFKLEKQKSKLQEQQEEDIEKLTNFLLHGGHSKQDTDTTFKRFDFDRFIKLITRDRLTYNYAAVEMVPTRDYSRISHFYPVSARTIRYVSARSQKHYKDQISPLLRDTLGYDKVEGTEAKPFRYVQVVRRRPIAAWTEDELIFEAGNPTVDPEDYGYGQGELEWLVNTITSHLYAESHNRNFFTQGIGNKGILHIKGDNISRAQLEGFKRQWFNQLSNTRNAFRPPIIGMADEVKYVSLAQSNREMEFTEWMNYLIKISCFPGETRVNMANGKFKAIRDIEPGDLVLTHSGNARKVMNTQTKPFSDELVVVTASGKVVKATPEHPFYVASSYVDSYMQHRFEDPEWVKASEIVENRDYLIVPRKKNPEIKFDKIDLSEYVSNLQINENSVKIKSNHSKESIRFINLTEDNAFVLGLYVSEGCSGKYSSTWCFSANEEHLAKAVEDFADRHGLKHSRPTCKDTALNVQVYSSVLARAFRELFGHLAPNKKVTTELLYSSQEVKKAFISGIIAGDGTVVIKKGRSAYTGLTSTSKVLVDQVHEMLKELGSYSFIYEYAREASSFKTRLPNYDLRISGTALIPLGTWLKDTKGDKLRDFLAKNSDTLKRHVYFDDSRWFVPVTKIHTEVFDGEVFNFEVEKEHTYVVEGFGVHNCAIYQVDPAEINFDITKTNSSTLNESSSEHRIKSSKNKGLRPLLMYLQNIINHQLIPRWDKKLADTYIFEFAGLDAETKMQEIDRLTKESQVYKTINEIRTEQGMSHLEDGDIILAATFTQYKQMIQQAAQMAEQQEMGMMGGEEDPGEEDDFSDIEGDVNDLLKELDKPAEKEETKPEETKKSLMIEYHHFEGDE